MAGIKKLLDKKLLDVLNSRLKLSPPTREHKNAPYTDPIQ